MPLPESFSNEDIVRISARRSHVYSVLIKAGATQENINHVRGAYLQIDLILDEISQSSQKEQVQALLAKMQAPKEQIISILKKYNSYPLP